MNTYIDYSCKLYYSSDNKTARNEKAYQHILNKAGAYQRQGEVVKLF